MNAQQERIWDKIARKLELIALTYNGSNVCISINRAQPDKIDVIGPSNDVRNAITALRRIGYRPLCTIYCRSNGVATAILSSQRVGVKAIPCPLQPALAGHSGN